MKTIEIRDEISTINSDIASIIDRLQVIEKTLVHYAGIMDELESITDMLHGEI